MRLLLVGIAMASATAIWMFVLITSPVAAVVMLVAGLAWDDRRRRRKATAPLTGEPPVSKLP